MTTPIIEKTWAMTRKNNIYNIVGYNNTNKEVLLWLKDLLKIAGWTVSGSGNGTTGAMDNVDRWSTITDLVPGDSSRSWIVLKNTAMAGGNFQLLIDYQNASAVSYQYDVYVSPGGNYTGGGTGKPTASDEVTIITNCSYSLESSGNSRRGVTVLYTSDHTSTRVIFCRANGFRALLLIETPRDPRSFWTPSWYCGYTVATIADMVSAYPMITSIDSFSFNFSLSSSQVVAAVIGQAWEVFRVPGHGNEMSITSLPILVSAYTARRGVLGRARDLWFVPDSVPTGEYFPGDGSRNFLCIEDVIIPWDPTAVFIMD